CNSCSLAPSSACLLRRGAHPDVRRFRTRRSSDLVTGGRTYGAIFGGGAEDAVLTFARLLRPGPLWGRLGLRARVVPVVVFLWVADRKSTRLNSSVASHMPSSA